MNGRRLFSEAGWKLVAELAVSAALLLSVAHDVKITSRGCAPINTAARVVVIHRSSTTSAFAVSITAFSFAPNL
jgi:hypothetical protein